MDSSCSSADGLAPREKCKGWIRLGKNINGKKRQTDIDVSTWFDRDRLAIYFIDDIVHGFAIKGH
jgi:hypothetical protein